MIRNRKQYIDAVLWDTAMGVCRADVRKNWPTLHGLPKDSAKYKIAVHEIEKLKVREFAQEWDALKEFLKT